MRLYKPFIAICIISFLLSGIGIGLTFNKKNKNEYVEYIENDYYVTNFKDIYYSNLVKIDNKKDSIDELVKSTINLDELKIIPKSENQFTKNISILNKIVLKNNKDEHLQLYLKNNNTLSIYVNFKLVYFDSDKNEESYIIKEEYILSNTEFTVDFNVGGNKNYSNYALEYYASNIENNTVSIDYINKEKFFAVQNSNGNIDILFKNLTINTIDFLKFSCVFYNDDILVGAFNAYSNLKILPNYGERLTCDLQDFSGFKYNKYKIILSEAYNMKQ